LLQHNEIPTSTLYRSNRVALFCMIDERVIRRRDGHSVNRVVTSQAYRHERSRQIVHVREAVTDEQHVDAGAWPSLRQRPNWIGGGRAGHDR
jgi:hypothetical protein